MAGDLNFLAFWIFLVKDIYGDAKYKNSTATEYNSYDTKVHLWLSGLNITPKEIKNRNKDSIQSNKID